MKNIKIKVKKIACGRCYHKGFDQVNGLNNRPLFICQQCGNQWSSGIDGKPYIEYANVDSRKFSTFAKDVLKIQWANSLDQ